MGKGGSSAGGAGGGGRGGAGEPLPPLSADNVADALRDVVPGLMKGPETGSGNTDAGFNPLQEGTHYGENKVFIHSAYDAIRKSRPDLSRERFNDILRTANSQGKISLSRADLSSAMHPKDIARSEIPIAKGEWDTFHFIRTDRNGFK